MSILLGRAALAGRLPVAEGALAPLVTSLRDDLAQVIARGEPFIPSEKARLTRLGGRCPAHGVLLDFDPWSPHEHRCPVCGAVYRDEAHYRWWIMNYQLWLAERALHGAALCALTGDTASGGFARLVLERYTDAYLRYPNADNVLGPTRPFFSTYLESIWILQLTIALDLLESVQDDRVFGAMVRERLIQPSAALVASYDEGRSNRQVWNDAAMIAAGVLLGDASLVDRAIEGPGGLEVHARESLLADGTWYEGENYHLFAHRGLWYVATIAEAQGWVAPRETARRIAEGFAAPFASALPDFTFPSRRDSQYRISLRQWRMAESCELGLARRDDERLRGALGELYRSDVPTGDSGRARATGEAERNVAPVRLTRASLGWKSLLFARPELPPLGGHRPASALLPAQGLGILRRDAGRTYVALDYGESGGGHGHPDRLNLWLVVRDARVLEDVGTGSYVDPSLHWYRSTLAHNAPLVDGRSQWRADGELVAWDERDGVGWISATAEIVPGVRVKRSVVVMDGYLVEELEWDGDRVVTLDLPWHVDATFDGGERFRSEPLGGGHSPEDGFAFVSQTEARPGNGTVALTARVGDVDVRAWIGVQAPHEWWRCVAPGPPGDAPRPFMMLRTRTRSGRMVGIWAWSRDVVTGTVDADEAVVRMRENERQVHRRDGAGWVVTQEWGDDAYTTRLRARRPASARRRAEADARDEGEGDDAGRRGETPSLAVPCVAVIDDRVGALVRAARTTRDGEGGAAPHTARSFTLARDHYRRSEQTWEEAGEPRAFVAIAADDERLVLECEVEKRPLAFAPPRSENPLDNEHPDTNSDGVQLYLGLPSGEGKYYAWILVPEPVGERVRVTPRSTFGHPLALQARWCETPRGYLVRCEIPRAALGDGVRGGEGGGGGFSLDLIVNETLPTRERRRGQLVLSGGHGEWTYLRGDRQDPVRALAFHIDAD